jgi:hypothetical protein
MKRPPLYMIPLVAVFIIIVLVQLGAPEPINWKPSFTKGDKIPYGASILFDLLPQLFNSSTMETNELAAYNALPDRFDSSEGYIVINDRFAADELDTRAITDYAERGNTVFIAAEDFSKPFSDSLGLETSNSKLPFNDSTSLNFTNPSLHATANYRYKQYTVDSYFSRFDTAHSVVLGENGERQVNFIMMKRGAGAIVLSTVPYAFTNYNMLDGVNREYAAKALAYLSAKRILWDEHYKAGRQTGSPLRYIVGLPALRWALYTLVLGVVLFMIFMGRRRQRIIPIIKPLPNTTLDFAETVAQLYFHHGDHKNIAEKRITYFLEHIRSTFGVNTGERSEEIYRMIAARSGVDVTGVRSIFGYIDTVHAAARIDADQLMALNKAIERFYSESVR